MANNINIPATGVGDATPRISTDQVTADSSQVQNTQLGSMSGGVLTRFSAGQKLMATSLPVVLPSDWVGITKPRTLVTYAAVFRLALAAASSGLAFTFTANTDKQLATLYHTGGAGKTVRLTNATLQIIALGAVAGQLQFEVRRLTSGTAPATGNPAITPVSFNPNGAAAEATALALPTTAGTEFAVDRPISSVIVQTIASEAPVVSTWPVANNVIELFDDEGGDETDLPTARPALAEGFAIVGRSTAAIPLTFIASMTFTEE